MKNNDTLNMRKYAGSKWNNLQRGEQLNIEVSPDPYEQDDFLAEAEDEARFVQQRGRTMTLAKEPSDTVSARKLFQALAEAKPLTPYFSQDMDRPVCKLLKTQEHELLGSGAEGGVYYFPEWRSNVAVKMSDYDFSYIEEVFSTEPKNGTYNVDSDVSELYASVLLNEIANSRGGDFSLFIPRFAAFATCDRLYNITEYIDRGTLNTFDTDDVLVIKSLLFQAIYTMLGITRVGFMHQDASVRNFLVKSVQPGDTYRNQDLYDAERWVLQLDGRSYSLLNTKFICKMTDFGFTIRDSEDPMPNLHIQGLGAYDKRWALSNKVSVGYDIVYFIASLDSVLGSKGADQAATRQVLRLSNVDQLLNDYADIVSEATGTPRSFDRILRDLFHDPPYNRPKMVLHNIRFEKLLESSYFDDVLQK